MASETPAPASAPRAAEHVTSLDGLRFLAAAVVLDTHVFALLTKPESVKNAVEHGPFAFLVSSSAAVTLFFVLSGYVLTGSAGRIRRPRDLAQFYVRRFFRIHPPFVFALLVAWLLSLGYEAPRGDGLSAYAHLYLGVHLAPQELLRHLWWPGSAADQLPPGWTLAVEMGLSLVLPFMVWLSRLTHWSVLLLLGFYPLVEADVGPRFLHLPYALCFAVGIALYEEREGLKRLIARLPRAAGIAGTLVGVFLFGLPTLLGLRDLGDTLLIETAAGAVLIGCALGVPWLRRALSGRVLARLGRVSYSFYLLHLPIVLVGLRSVSGPVGWVHGGLLWAGSLLLTSGAALLAHRFVELPSIRAGNALCRAIARGSGRPAQLSDLLRPVGGATRRQGTR